MQRLGMMPRRVVPHEMASDPNGPPCARRIAGPAQFMPSDTHLTRNATLPDVRDSLLPHYPHSSTPAARSSPSRQHMLHPPPTWLCVWQAIYTLTQCNALHIEPGVAQHQRRTLQLLACQAAHTRTPMPSPPQPLMGQATAPLAARTPADHTPAPRAAPAAPAAPHWRPPQGQATARYSPATAPLDRMYSS